MGVLNHYLGWATLSITWDSLEEKIFVEMCTQAPFGSKSVFSITCTGPHHKLQFRAACFSASFQKNRKCRIFFHFVVINLS